MTIDEDKNSGAADDEEESPSSRLGGDTATDGTDEEATSREVRKAAVGEREPPTH